MTLSALQWIKQCKLLGDKDIDEVFLMGDSAGGCLVNMAALVIQNPEFRTFIFGSNAFPSCEGEVIHYCGDRCRIVSTNQMRGEPLRSE